MVSKARLDFPLPLGPVMTVICPSGRSTLMPLRLFCRAPRISMQPHFVGAVTHGLATTFEPTVKYPRCRVASQIWLIKSRPRTVAEGARGNLWWQPCRLQGTTYRSRHG